MPQADGTRWNAAGSPWLRWKERLITGLLTLSLLAVVLPVLAILWLLITRGVPAITWEFLTRDPQTFALDGTLGGIRAAIVGTVYLVLLTVLLAVPVGVMAAVYLTEYAKQNVLTRAIRLAIVNLAGVPSVVYGLFGLGLFVYFLKFGVSLLAGACTLAVLVLPLIITASEEALLTVPASFREASLALGASKWQTIWQIVLPTALPGVLTGIILAIGRAAGETAPVMFTCAAAIITLTDLKPQLRDPVMLLSNQLYILATSTSARSGKQMELLMLNKWGTALVLLALVLGMNVVALLFRAKLRKARKW
jgi:phosphate transport system permease protein